MAETKTKPMTLTDFNKLEIVNYAVGKTDQKYFITVLRTRGEPMLKEFPKLEDEQTVECSKELYNHLGNEVFRIKDMVYK